MLTLRCSLDVVERQMEENWFKVVCGHPVTVAMLLSISLLLLQRGLRWNEGLQRLSSVVDSDFQAIWHLKRLRLCSVPCDSEPWPATFDLRFQGHDPQLISFQEPILTAGLSLYDTPG